jgi:hypothetical protein
MPRVYIFVLFAVCYVFQASAAEPSISGTYRHQGWCVINYGNGIRDSENWKPCKKYPVNSLTIKEFDSGEYAVSFEFTSFATTPSYCNFSGIFSRHGDFLELTEPYKTMACQIKIRVSKDKFVFEDPSRSCHNQFCSGTNQSINDYEFPRWDNPSKSW